MVRINNKKAFILGKIPSLHPDGTDYKKFWRQQIRYCLEGFWGLDGTGWRFMPPVLYFFINFCKIALNPKGGTQNKGKKLANPDLRDIDWEWGYNWFEARGFSGFDEDDEFTCCTEAIKYKENKWLEYDDPNLNITCYNKAGKLKTYVPAREYLRRLFDKPMGKALYWNSVKNLMVMGSRNFGKSYWCAALIEHTFVFDGALSYEEFLEGKNKAEIFIGASASDKSSDTLGKFITSWNNMDGSYGTGNDYTPPPFYKQTTGDLKPNNGQNVFRHEYQAKEGGIWTKKGSMTSIKHGIYTTNNPDAASGTRPILMIIEEIGLMENLIHVHSKNEACQRGDGTVKFGSSFYVGTGGNVDKVKECEEAFRNPDELDFLSFEDEYENTGRIGWFMPYMYTLSEFRDENGNLDVEKARAKVEEEREKKRKSKSASNSYDYYIMNFPQVPSEIFLSRKGNFFPLAELREREKELKEGNKYLKYESCMSFAFSDKHDTGVEGKFISHEEGRPLNKHKKNSKDYDSIDGCCVVYEQPLRIGGMIPQGLYMFSLDPYNSNDQEEGSSLGAFYVFKTGRYESQGLGYHEIVAEYVGKHRHGMNKFYEEIEKIIMYYGGSPGLFYYENNVGITYEYFAKKNKLGYLAPTPIRVMKNQVFNIGSSGVAKFGYSVRTAESKAKILTYLCDWLLEERVSEGGRTIRNLNLIKSLGLIQELIAFEFNNGNFDRVMGFAGCILGLREVENELAEKINFNIQQEELTSFKRITRNGQRPIKASA